MPQLDATSVDGDTADWTHDGESSVGGDAGRRRRYNYAKCAACREQKKKVPSPIPSYIMILSDFLTSRLLCSVRAR
jgi:hypothetical protein